MKKLRTLSLLLLFLALFCAIDLGLNFSWSLVPGQDGIGNYSLLHTLFGIFGDSLWSVQRYLEAFQTALWTTFALLLENALLYLISKKER